MAGRLGDILIARGQITENQLQSALAAQGSERGMLGAIPRISFIMPFRADSLERRTNVSASVATSSFTWEKRF